MTPSPTVTKPSTTWVKYDIHGHWHYIKDASKDASFCGSRALVQTALHSRTSWPKKKECCSTCHAEATRLQELWNDRSQSWSNALAQLYYLDASTNQKSSSAFSDADKFVVAIKALAHLGHCCNNILEQKLSFKTGRVCGRIKVAPAMIQHWICTCTDTFEMYPKVANFWHPVLAKLSRPGNPCSYFDLVNHVAATSDVYQKFRAEELTETQNDRLIKQRQQSSAKKVKEPARRQILESSKMEFVAPQKRIENARQRQLELLNANARWNTYERQGTRSYSSDPAKNSESGVPGNPTHRRR